MEGTKPKWLRDLPMLMLCLALSACLTPSQSIRHAEYVPASDGAELFLLTRGADTNAPVMLWLHGGPGGAERPLFRYYNSELENHFVVAYWDQRGAGRSFDADASTDALTIDQHLADLDIIVEHLHQRLGKESLILVGHSWGSALGLLYAREHPGKVSAIVGVNPLVATLPQQQARYNFLLNEAQQQNDNNTLIRLQEIGSPPHTSSELAMQVERIAGSYGAIFHNPPNYVWVSVRAIFTGLVTPFEIPRIIRGNNVSLEAMHNELLELDLFELVPALAVPTHFFVGRYDRHVDATVAADYLERLDAPGKSLTWFEQSAHNIPFEEPDTFHAHLLELFDAGFLTESSAR